MQFLTGGTAHEPFGVKVDLVKFQSRRLKSGWKKMCIYCIFCPVFFDRAFCLEEFYAKK